MTYDAIVPSSVDPTPEEYVIVEAHPRDEGIYITSRVFVPMWLVDDLTQPITPHIMERMIELGISQRVRKPS